MERLLGQRATSSVCTYTRLRRCRTRLGSDSMLAYLPYSIHGHSRVLRTIYLIDVVREWWQAWQQQSPQCPAARSTQNLKYSFIRAATTTAMQEASRAILTADLLLSQPAVYNTFYGYDEVAHHAGIDRPDCTSRYWPRSTRIFADPRTGGCLGTRHGDITS